MWVSFLDTTIGIVAFDRAKPRIINRFVAFSTIVVVPLEVNPRWCTPVANTLCVNRQVLIHVVMVCNHNSHTHYDEIEANGEPVDAQSRNITDDLVFPAIGRCLRVRSIAYSVINFGSDI